MIERQSCKKKRREKIWSLVEPMCRSCSSALDLVQQGDLLEDISHIFLIWRFKRFSLPCFRLWGRSLSSGRTQSRCKRRWSHGKKRYNNNISRCAGNGDVFINKFNLAYYFYVESAFFTGIRRSCFPFPSERSAGTWYCQSFVRVQV